MRPEGRVECGWAATPRKVIGLGAPISVCICFERIEIPALLDAIAEELARHGRPARIDGRIAMPDGGPDPHGWRDHVHELRRMLRAVEEAAQTPVGARFAVLWPTVVAHDVVHGAVAHAARRAAATLAGGQTAARAALVAARRTVDDFQTVDGGGLDAVWL